LLAFFFGQLIRPLWPTGQRDIIDPLLLSHFVCKDSANPLTSTLRTASGSQTPPVIDLRLEALISSRGCKGILCGMHVV
jgi:hypothetical protein